MKRLLYSVFTSLLSISLLILGCRKSPDTDPEQAGKTSEFNEPVFTKVLPEQSQVYFENRLQEDLSTLENLFDFDYFYNGAGTGVADLNNDGLLDIFFCGNQVPNKLYINKGDMVGWGS
ncbi:MAG: hypothetical protein P8X60_01120 [Robiginitalea sp.]